MELKNSETDYTKKVADLTKDYAHLTDDLETRLKELKAKTEELVKKYPLASIAVAFGVGFLLAKIFRRRS